MPATTTRFLALSVMFSAAVMFASCTQQTPVSSEPPAAASGESSAAPDQAAATAEPIPVTNQMREVLAKADEVDGTADKTISKCAACNLGMDGSAEHSLKVGEYTLLFCSDDCKQSYAKDSEKAILGMQLPAAKPATGG